MTDIVFNVDMLGLESSFPAKRDLNKKLSSYKQVLDWPF